MDKIYGNAAAMAKLRWIWRQTHLIGLIHSMVKVVVMVMVNRFVAYYGYNFINSYKLYKTWHYKKMLMILCFGIN